MHTEYRLHHIGILVSDLARVAQNLISRFGYIAESSVIEDPRQTAFAQFLRLPGADHWTELIAPNGPESVLIGALKQRRGGTHHLCYEVVDIDASFEQLGNNSMTQITGPVPGIAFDGRRIAWLIDRDNLLVELLERGDGPLVLPKNRSDVVES